MVQVKVGIFELEAPYIAGAVGMRPKKPGRLFITTGRVTTGKVTLMALCLECFMSLNDTENKISGAACSLGSSKLRMHYAEVCIRVRSFFLCTNTFSKYVEARHMSRHASEAVLHSQFPHMATDKESYSTYQWFVAGEKTKTPPCFG